MKILRKVMSIVLVLSALISSLVIVSAKRYRVKTHTRHYKNGKVVRIGSHTRTTKNK